MKLGQPSDQARLAGLNQSPELATPDPTPDVTTEATGPAEATGVPPKVTRSRRWFRVRLLLLLGLLIGTLISIQPRDPRSDLAVVIEDVHADEGASTLYSYEFATMGFLPKHGYTLTLYVEGQEGFSPARYFILTRIDGEYTGDLMISASRAWVRQLRGQELRDYMRRAGLDLASADAVFEKFYAE
jgi:hypothetical protein